MLDRLKLLCVFVFIGWSQLVSAAVDPVTFGGDVDMEHRYQELTQVLRCPKCQNQSIAGSDAPIAKDMRRKVEALMKEGRSDQDIEEYMIDRYGEFVTYDPPVSSRTYILWFAPPVFFVFIGLCFILAFRKSPTKATDKITDTDKLKSKE